MKTLASIFILLSLSFAQDTAPTGNRVVWNPSAPDAAKELPDGRTQRTVTTQIGSVSVIADVVSARRFIDPPADGGNEVTYVVIGIRNTSQNTVHINPDTIALRTTGKKDKEYKSLAVEKVIERAWQGSDNRPAALPAMSGSMSSGAGGDASIRSAVSQSETDVSNRRGQQASEQQTGMQVVKLRDKALLPRELAPGEAVMGMVFFYPFEKKDQLELTIPVGDTTFVFQFSGKKR